MDKNKIYEKIVELGGDCLKSKERPPCAHCPFQKDCMSQMILLAKNIPKEARLRWALDKLVEEYILNDEET